MALRPRARGSGPRRVGFARRGKLARPELVYLNGKRREDLEGKPGSGQNHGPERRESAAPVGGFHPAIVEVNRITQIARRCVSGGWNLPARKDHSLLKSAAIAGYFSFNSFGVNSLIFAIGESILFTFFVFPSVSTNSNIPSIALLGILVLFPSIEQ